MKKFEPFEGQLDSEAVSPEVINWEELLETEPPLGKLLPLIAALGPEESLDLGNGKAVIYITNRPKLGDRNAAEILEKTDGNTSALIALALEDAAKKLGLETPNIAAYFKTVQGIPETESGAIIKGVITGLMNKDPIEGERFLGDWEQLVEKVDKCESTRFTFVPEDINTFNIQRIKDYFADKGVDTSLMDITISEMTTSDNIVRVAVRLDPKTNTSRIKIVKVFRD